MAKKEFNPDKGPPVPAPRSPSSPRPNAGRASPWEELKPTINHDLPNMIVALQGLLQMLTLEEGARLSPAGQDYLQRLSNVSQKLQNTVTTLRQIHKAGSQSALAEDIVLMELVREVAAAAKNSLPMAHLVFHSVLRVPRCKAPRLLLHQALLEIVRLLSLGREQGDFHCFLASRRSAGKVELAVGVKVPEAATTSASAEANTAVPTRAFFTASVGNLDYQLFGQEQRLALVLIEELARNWGGETATCASVEEGTWVCVTIPDEPN